MTLVELLVATIISGIIISAMAAAFFVVVHHRDPAEDRLLRSQDAQILANYVAQDAASSGDQTVPEVSLTDPASCTDPNPPVAGSSSLIVRMKWSATTLAGATVTKVVNYNKVGDTVLRLYCSGGSVTSDVTVAHSVASVTASCTPTDCGTTASGVKLNVTETLGSGDATAYQYTLAGTFRKRPGGGVTPTPPTPITAALITLSTGTGNGLDLTSNSANLTIKTGNTVYSNSNIELNKPGALNLSGTSTIESVGTVTCDHNSPGTCPTTATLTAPLVDPYQGVTCPTTDLNGTNLPTYAGSNYQGPGIYTDQLKISSAQVFASGRYVLKNGFNRTGNGAITGTNVLFCVDGGSWTNSGSGSNTFTAETTSGPSPFVNVVLFQPKSNTNTMVLRSGDASYSTIVYAGGATVDLGGSGALTSTSVIAASATWGGNGTATLGY
ncbi:MAG TPA: hypothetical protein VFE55_20850 [Acidimicrobiia bacterium]|nr:hypothetical protein [Acidimicrobiia bacterium]